MKEICICAAVRTKDGTVIRGHRHADALQNALNRQPPLEFDHGAPWQGQGFVTSTNRFVDRTEGALLQRLAGIPSVMTKQLPVEILFSEDLY